MYNVIPDRQPAQAHGPRPGLPGVWGLMVLMVNII